MSSIWPLAKNANSSTSAPPQQNSKLDSETINHLWLQIKNLVKLQFTSIAPHIRFKIFLFKALIKLAMIARKLINYLLQRKLIGVPNYSRYHLMVLTKDRNSIQRIVPYPHCILITSSHKIKLWEESAPALATKTTTHKLANNTGTKRFQHDSPLILSITQIPLNNPNSKRYSKKKKKKKRNCWMLARSAEATTILGEGRAPTKGEVPCLILHTGISPEGGARALTLE